MNLHKTTYNKLAKTSTVDFVEMDPKIKNYTFFMKEKLIYEPESFDKYATMLNIHLSWEYLVFLTLFIKRWLKNML